MASSSNIKQFRMVAEARGGTFTFREGTSSPTTTINEINHTHVDLIGTFHCNTCLAIYFPIDKHRCFMMHCNAWTRYQEPLNFAEPEIGEELKKAIIKKLWKEAEDNDWNPRSDGFAEVVYAACPVYKVDFDGEVAETGGYYAAEAVREFLRDQAYLVSHSDGDLTALQRHANAIRHQADTFVVHTDLQGFVIHNNSRKLVATFQANADDLFYKRSPADLGPYRPVTIISLEICKWSVCVDDQEAIILQQMFRAHLKGVKSTQQDVEEINRMRADPQSSSQGEHAGAVGEMRGRLPAAAVRSRYVGADGRADSQHTVRSLPREMRISLPQAPKPDRARFAALEARRHLEPGDEQGTRDSSICPKRHDGTGSRNM